MADKDLQEISFDILREIYDEAEPGIDFDDALENPEDYEEGWFSNHYLADARQREILNEHCDQYDLSDSEQSSIVWTVILNYGPVGHRKATVEQ